MPNPQYTLKIRDHNLQPVGELSDFLDADFVLRFNEVGSFVVTVRADASLKQFFAAGYGLILTRDLGEGAGASTLFSGPFWHLERLGRDNTYVLAGPSDDWWLKARKALPYTGANYDTMILAEANLIAYWKMDDVGSSLVDSKNANNGTFTGSPTKGVTGLIQDDPGLAMKFPSSSIASVTMATPSATLTAPYTVEFVIPSGANGVVCGSRAPNDFSFDFRIDSQSGASNVRADVGTGVGWLNTAFITAVVPQTPQVHVAITVTATASTIYFNGVNVGGNSWASNTPLLFDANHLWKIGGSGSGGFWGNNAIDSFAIYNTNLSGSTIAAHAALALSPFAKQAYDVRTGVCTTVMRQYVDNNAGPSALPLWQVPGLALASDPANGTTVTGNARFEGSLLALLQQLANSGGDMGFYIRQTANGVITFTPYAPVDKSLTAKFSTDLRNLLDFSYSLDGPQANRVIVGGGGDLTARVFIEQEDATSVATWGRVVSFVDARDTSDPATLIQRGQAELATNKQITNLSLTPIDTPAVAFQRDYTLGDIIAVTVDGATITAPVREVHIQLNNQDQELLTPAIGNVGAGQIARLYDAKQRALESIQRRLDRLEAGK